MKASTVARGLKQRSATPVMEVEMESKIRWTQRLQPTNCRRASGDNQGRTSSTDLSVPYWFQTYLWASGSGNRSLQTNRRPASPLNAGQRFGRAVHASASLSAGRLSLDEPG
jgi:hypothetical protein